MTKTDKETDEWWKWSAVKLSICWLGTTLYSEYLMPHSFDKIVNSFKIIQIQHKRATNSMAGNYYNHGQHIWDKL